MEQYIVEIQVESLDECENLYTNPVKVKFPTLEEALLGIRVLRRVVAYGSPVYKTRVSASPDSQAWGKMTDEQRSTVVAEDDAFEVAWEKISEGLNPFCWVREVKSLKRVVEEVLPLPPR